MWRSVLLALILGTGCAGGHEKQDAELTPTSSWSLGDQSSDKYKSAHPSAGPEHHQSEDVGSDILGGFLQGVVDLLFGS